MTFAELGSVGPNFKIGKQGEKGRDWGWLVDWSFCLFCNVDIGSCFR